MTRLTAAFAVLLAAALLNSCSRIQTYEEAPGREADAAPYEDGGASWEDADQGETYVSSQPADEVYVTETEAPSASFRSWVSVPAFSSSSPQPAVTVPAFSRSSSWSRVTAPVLPRPSTYSSAAPRLPAFPYSASPRTYLPPNPACCPPAAAPSFAPSLRPAVTAPYWGGSLQPSSAALRVPPPVFIGPVRLCPY